LHDLALAPHHVVVERFLDGRIQRGPPVLGQQPFPDGTTPASGGVAGARG
jgi:hypothetical protein